jgi:membrane-bound serine protease (ClpP class)
MVALGILLIVLGVGLIIGEFFTGSHLLVALGIVFALLGLIFWATSGTDWLQVNWWLVALILIIVFGILGLAVFRIRNTFHRQVTTGKEDLKGKTAIVKEPLKPEGTVLYKGELWNAISTSGKIESGAQVVIIGVDGLTLSVTKKEKT